MRVTSFEELSHLGWAKRVNDATKRVSYVRPNKTIVNQRRDLSDSERDEIGDILFPGKLRVNVAPQSVNSTEPPSSAAQHLPPYPTCPLIYPVLLQPHRAHLVHQLIRQK